MLAWTGCVQDVSLGRFRCVQGGWRRRGNRTLPSVPGMTGVPAGCSCPSDGWWTKIHESGFTVEDSPEEASSRDVVKSGSTFAEKSRFIRIHLCSVLSQLPTGLPVSSIRLFPVTGRSTTNARREARTRKCLMEGGGEVMKKKNNTSAG